MFTIRLFRIIRTPKGVEIERRITELTNKFENYMRLLFDDWRHIVPQQIQEKIMYPLFTINDNYTISINFAKEVILLYIYFHL